MSARNCPKCQRELPVEVLRALEQGVPCPFCATRLKSTPRRSPTIQGPAGGDRAVAEVSHTPPVIAQPPGEDSYRWFQTKGSPAAPAAAVERAPVRSPLKPLPVGGMPGLTPPTAPIGAVRPAPPPAPTGPSPAARPAAAATAPTEVAKRPAPLAAAPPAPPVEPRRAPTIVGIAPPPVQPPTVHPPAAEPPRAPAAEPPRTPATEPPRAALAIPAVLPAGGSTLALAAPTFALSSRSGRKFAVAGGTALAVAAVGLLLLHHSPADRPAPMPLATLRDPPGASPAVQPLHTDLEPVPARPVAAAPPVEHAKADVERGTAEPAIPKSHGKTRVEHRPTAHQRRYAKRDKHDKRARHERRSSRRTELASRSTPAPADHDDARASYARGNAMLFSGDAAGAVAAYQKAVELAPADPIGYRGLGLAYEQQGGTRAAIRALRKYLKLAPGAADREIISRRIARLGQAESRP